VGVCRPELAELRPESRRHVLLGENAARLLRGLIVGVGAGVEEAQDVAG
jgi:hypothetical protein